jgi:PAS domain S-box-containing protein
MTDPQRVLVLGNPSEGVDPLPVLSETAGFAVETACDHNEAHDRLTENNIDCIVTSLDSATTNTMAIAARNPDIPVLVVAKSGSESVVVELDTPIAIDDVSSSVAQRTVLSHQLEAAVSNGHATSENPAQDVKTVCERVTDGIFAVDTNWRYTYANSEAAALTNQPKNDLIGMSVWEAFPELTDSPFEDVLQRGMESGESLSVEAKYEPHGVWYDVRVYPDDAGISIYFRDVTEAVARRKKLQRENERLEKFVSIVSHDLRNPLNVIEGALELIEETGEVGHAELGLNGVDRMETLITDLLELAKQGNRVETTESTVLANICTRCWETVETGAARLDVTDGYTITADQGRLKQLLENLFRNAIEHGGDDVTVSVGPLPDAAGFYVADDGSGIPADERETVFEHGYTTATRGTGFGLSIVKEIARAHGWKITVTESESGGARFEITGVNAVDTGT